jgi:hypothetical protein
MLLRVEDFRADPPSHLRLLAVHLQLPMPTALEDLLDLPPQGGGNDAILADLASVGIDSAQVVYQLQREPDYMALCAELGYDPHPVGVAAGPGTSGLEPDAVA